MKKRIALLLAMATIISTTPVMAARYEDNVYVEVVKDITITAGKEESKTARVEVELLEDNTLEGENLEILLSSGCATTMSALYIAYDKDVEDTRLNVIKSQEGDYYEIELPAETVEGDKVEIEVKGLYHPLDADVKEIALRINSTKSYIDQDVVIAEVEQPVTIEVEKATIKPGLKDQTGGKIVITENDNGMIERGQIRLVLSDDYVKFDGEPKITATNGIKVDSYVEISRDGTEMIIDVKRASSRYKGQIVIEDLVFSTSGATPNGGWYLDVSGTSLCADDDEAYWFEDFVVVTDEEQVEVTTSVVTFMIGSPFYMINSEMIRMDAAPYIAEERTMMPVRYVSNALGIQERNILYANDTITIFHGEDVIQMTVGSKEVRWNNVPIVILDTPVSVVNGRAYVPVAQLGAIFGTEVTWDAKFKTVTFIVETKN